MAAKMRVTHFEDLRAGGLQVVRRAWALEMLLVRTTFLLRKARWGAWYQQSALLVLRAADQEFRALGFSRAEIEDRAAGHAPQPWTDALVSRVRRDFQRTARAAWAERQNVITPEDRLRHKLGLRGFHDRRQMVRCLERLRYVARQAPPRVAAAAFGCLWNRWATAHRFQRRGSSCLLGCGRGEDSVEHYCACRVSRAFGWEHLAVRYRFSVPWEHWMFTAPECMDSEEASWFLRVAALQYSVLRTTNAARHHGGLTEVEASRALRQALVEGVRGHHLTGKIQSALRASRR